jgi:NADPH:quinone reductase-like Zn-dependent oxidoreductase
MRAAVVESFQKPPRYATFDEPSADAGELLLSVRAAALSNLVRAQASGRHYSAPGRFPFVAGNDGVGVTPEGQRVYFFAPRAPFGAMAERTVVAREGTLVLPDAIDDVTAAALGNPGLASWGALIGRARLQRGEAVLVNGATGVSGQQAVQVAKHLGARKVIATGRNRETLERLRGLGADEVIPLDQPEEALLGRFRAALREERVEVVLDYLWGPSAALILKSAGGHGAPEGEPRVRFVQIGAMSAPSTPVTAEWLRGSGLELLGSGLGSLSTTAMFEALRVMYAAYAQRPFAIDTRAVPLAGAEQAWGESESGTRTVFVVG